MKKRSSLSARVVRATIAGIASVATLGGLASGCLDRPVSPASPNTTNVFVDQIRQSGVDKIDMLFMIDNSISMADKQKILQAAVPKLVERLVTPRCVDTTTGLPVGGNADAAGTCANGEPEFPPIKDIHLGVITSSLGAHGGETCSLTSPGSNPTQDDKGRLVGFTRQLPNHEQPPIDFLWWNPGTDAADQADSNTLITEFSAQVVAAGETGCGYEASLEAWYRFLVDPQPPDTVKKDGNFTVVEACPQEGADCGAGGICIGGFCADKTVLAQRQAFLRGDSLVAVVMLTDENDCSIRDDGQGWLVSIASPGLPRSTAACLTNPDDACCTSCAAPPGPGCAPHGQDAECSKNGGTFSGPEDHVNLRCWEQKKRYGVDFLYPLNRYVNALKNPSVTDRGGNSAPNPLFSTGGGVSRDPSLIFLAGIVGVPWQAIATDDSQAAGAPLKYKNARDIDWPAITRTGNTPPTNPRMVESIALRPGLPDFNTPNADPVHGHDFDIIGSATSQGPADLQYACIFPLAQTRDCAALSACDCKTDTGVAAKSPLCWDGTQFSTVQTGAKAYPGLRELEVLRDFGDNAIVASICPKEAINQNDPSFGYNPAVDAIVDRLKEQLSGSCLTRPVTVVQNPDGTTSTQCAIVEVEVTQGGACGCDGNQNRKDPDAKLIKPVLDGLRKDRICGAAGQPACSQTDFCLCEIGEANPKSSCENDPNPQGVGWCYIDPFGDPAVGNADLVKDCNPQRQLRFIGSSAGVPTPKKNSIVFIACLGKPLGE
jgi:hypothetical protein